ADIEFGIVSEAAARAVGGRWPGGRTVGAGPFQVKRVSPSEVVLERNEHWVGGPPPLRRLVFRPLTDANARLLMLVGGSADLAQNTLRPDLADVVADKPRLRIERGDSALLSYMLLRNDDPILRDVRVRRAIALALD